MTVLVTGAAGAIGSAIVEALIASGQLVIEHDLRFASAARQDVARIKSDLTTEEGCATVATAATAHALTGVVASHGIQGAGSLHDLSVDTVRRIFVVNAATIPTLWEACRSALERSRGVFVTVASQAALRAEPENAAYCAAKWSVLEWTRQMAVQVSPDVALRALCPGRTESRLLFDSMDEVAAGLGITRAEYESKVLEEIPIGRFARPAEIAAAAVYLLERKAPRPVVLATTGGEVPW